MRSAGTSNAAAVAVIGVDGRTMGQIRELLGTEVALPQAAFSFEEAIASIRRLQPSVVLTGFDQDFEEAIRIAPLIQSELAGVTLVALASHADPDRIRAAMRAGYREFVVLPEDANLLRQAIYESSLSGSLGDDAGEVVVLWGGKGGVGTTLLAVNLAAELSPVHRVCVVDLDFSTGDVAAYLDLPHQHSINDLMRNLHRLDDRMLSGHVLVHSSKVHVLAQPMDLEQREEVKGESIMRMLTAVARSYQYVIVDCGSRLDEAVLTALTLADRILIVATPDVPGIKNSWRRVQLLERLGVDKKHVHLVVNRWAKKNALSRDEIESNLGRKIAVTLAEDPVAPRAINEGRLIREVDRKSPLLTDLEAMVGLVTDGEVQAEKKPEGVKGWFSFLK